MTSSLKEYLHKHRTIGLTEKWTRYVMKIECRICGESIYNHESDARSDIQHILSENDFGPTPTIDDLRDALTWLEHKGKYCDYHAEQIDDEMETP